MTPDDKRLPIIGEVQAPPRTSRPLGRTAWREPTSDPYDTHGLAEELSAALNMPAAQQRNRNRLIRDVVRQRNVYRWATQRRHRVERDTDSRAEMTIDSHRKGPAWKLPAPPFLYSIDLRRCASGIRPPTHGPGGRRFVARITLPEPGAYKIGRSVGNQIKLDFADVSRTHAFLNVTSSGFYVLNRSNRARRSSAIARSTSPILVAPRYDGRYWIHRVDLHR